MITYPIGLLRPKNIVDNSFKLSINTALGTGTTFTLPLPSGETYDFWWSPGDGSPDRHVVAYNDINATYDYGVAFSGQIIIGTQSGDKCGGWSFNNTGDKLKVTSIDQWGNVGFDNIVGGFDGCTNLTLLPTEGSINSTTVTSVQRLFQSCRFTTLPPDTLRLLPNLSIATAFCNSVITLTAIHGDTFKYNTLLTNVLSAFSTNISVSSIGEDLFYYNPLITSYSSTFTNCRNVVLPTRMFNLSNLSIVVDFTNFMRVASTIYSFTGTIQDIWNYALTAAHPNAFLNQTAITNYASIPNDWKGL